MRPLLALAAALGLVAAPIHAAAPEIAITFDDLPAHGPLPPGETRLEVIDAIIAALKAHHIADVHGFVSAGFGAGEPQAGAVLDAWRAAGFPLGNHTYSHMNLSQNSVADWEAQVVKDEPFIAPRMAGRDWHWLRYPYLAEGGTPAKTAAARAFLRQRGYKIAAVTMSFSDYLWNEPYARCATRGDSAAIGAIGAMEASYLKAAQLAAARARTLAHAAFGHDVPYVLLMHVGAFDARVLPRLLDQYQREGFRFVPLEQAERDPFYRSAIDLSLPGPSPTLEAAVAAKGVAVPPGPAMPDPSGLCR